MTWHFLYDLRVNLSIKRVICPNLHRLWLKTAFMINSSCASDEKLGQSGKILKSVNDPLQPTAAINCKSSVFV